MHNGTLPRFGFLIDMDGVLYRGTDLIPGADRPEVVVDSLAELADRMECHGWRPSWRTAKERLAMAV